MTNDKGNSECHQAKSLNYPNNLFGWREEGGGVKESRVEFAKNKLILC